MVLGSDQLVRDQAAIAAALSSSGSILENQAMDSISDQGSVFERDPFKEFNFKFQ